MRAEPRSRALFVFVGNRGQSMKLLTWDGTGVLVRPGERHLVVSDAIFEGLFNGVSATPREVRRRLHGASLWSPFCLSRQIFVV